MSRTPTMTAADAESILGARGNLSVTADNRATLKKWLSAKGVKSALAARMNYADMSGAYNDITDQCIKVLLAEGKDLAAEQADLEDTEESDTITTTTVTAKVEVKANGHAKPVAVTNDGTAGGTLA